MCGIVGIINLREQEPVTEGEIRQMLAMIRHRGPDEFGIYLDGAAGLGNARLSIIDLSSGQQPIGNEDGSLWIVFNGEIFNYLELRPELEALGHQFKTSSDTEVLLHAVEEWGAESLERLNGQFAFAVWNARERSLFLARDRVGIRPLFYTVQGGRLIFGSEVKAVLSLRGVTAELDPEVMEQVFTFWAPISPRTIFKGIMEVPSGSYLEVRGAEWAVLNPQEGTRPEEQSDYSPRRFWEIAFEERSCDENAPTREGELVEELGDLLLAAAKIRLRADVPVGAYLSGGLDSSLIASIIRNSTNNHLDTFSIAFDDENFDESAWQLRMAKFLGTQHQVVRATHADIGRVFPDVIWHAEVPLMRTAPAPMFLLSKLARDANYKVVLTGEGADEFLAGYDIFKEAKVRRFWARAPRSAWRPLLLQKLYPDIRNLGKTNARILAAFFREGLEDVGAPYYSHALRWKSGRRLARFFSDAVRSQLSKPVISAVDALLPARFAEWSPLARAQYLEIRIFLSQYLLASQGDRMGMAHSIEGRFPFLDFRVIEFCNRLPSQLKLRGLKEKYLLKQLGKTRLPPEIWQRPKRPYRAPIHRSFFNESEPTADYVAEALSIEKVKAAGYFNPRAVEQLVQKVRQGSRTGLGETDDMALAGIISTQLLHEQFIARFRKRETLSDRERVKVVKGGMRRADRGMELVE